MNFTAKDVANLREKTGCGMMDCKKALTEAEGNMEKAIDLLREKGLAASVKKAGRIAAEGVAFAEVSECGKVAVAVEVRLRCQERRVPGLCQDLRRHRYLRKPRRR